MLRTLNAQDAALVEILGSSHQRLQQLISEANERSQAFYEQTLGRAMSMEAAVAEIFAAVETEGDAAVCRYSAAFDKSQQSVDDLIVERPAMAAAWEATAPELQKP